ncbi:hypothetical protein H072_9838 [Dactylellina haptotyla CBS 200.50]|uniref:Uncharacterized protein n=1 Tax=Dactylellina haptotyla (strain CBS 200.50) TaxID=1284197 RepID=S8A0P0_DACHA|nr:hypothetical protein H072_9838 [Dactylellina haptotyla CBS 200.50]
MTRNIEKNNDRGNIEYPDGDSTHEADTSGWLSKEIEAQKDVEVTINQIVRLTVAIRKAGSDARLKRADRSFDLTSPKVQELKAFLELIVHPRGFKTEGQLNAIQLRLIEANLRRSHRFSYAKLHARNLARRDTGPAEDLLEGLTSILHSSSNPDPKPSPSSNATGKEGATAITAAPREGAVSVIAPTATTAASAIEGTVIVSDKERMRTSATVITRVSSKVVYPRPPIVHNTVFKCPCCQQSLPDAYSERSQWKKYLASDILPYTCVFQNCKLPLQLYLTREDWERHITTDHGQYWSCAACEQIGKRTEFSTENELVDHLRTAHRDSVDPQEIPMFVTASSSSKPVENIDCPLCPGPTDGEDSLDHIAHCIHDFLLYSLPLPSDSDADDDYFDIDSRNSNLLNTPSSYSAGREAENFVQSDYEGSYSGDENTEIRESMEFLFGDSSEAYHLPPNRGTLHSTDNSLYSKTSTTESGGDDSDGDRYFDQDNDFDYDGSLNVRDEDGNLDIGRIPAKHMKEGVDWFAYFNPRVPRVLDIDLFHTLEHDSVVYCIWDVEQRDVKHNLYGHRTDVCSVEYSNDGRFICSASFAGTVKIWLVPKSDHTSIPYVMATLADELNTHVACAAISPDSRSVAVGFTDGSICIWDIFSRRLVIKLDRSYRVSEGLESYLERKIPHGLNEGHRDCVNSVSFTGDGTGLVSGSQDKTIKIWALLSTEGADLKHGRLETTLTGHDNSVWSVAQTPDIRSQWLVSGSWDKRVEFWDPALDQPQLLLQGHRNGVRSAALNPPNDLLATGSSDFTARIWRYWKVDNKEASSRDKQDP